MFDSQQNSHAEIIGKLPVGAIVDSQWMNRHGISHSLRHYYAQNGVLAKLGRRLYAKDAGEIEVTAKQNWKGVVTSMAQLMKVEFHIGGLTALNLPEILYSIEGYEEQAIFLYGANFPVWLTKVSTDRPILLRRNSLFKDTEIGLRTIPIRSFQKTSKTICRVSTRERAILEMIDEAYSNVNLESVEETFRQGSAMRSSMLQMLLEDCQSPVVVKVVLDLGHKYNFDWLHGIDRQKFAT